MRSFRAFVAAISITGSSVGVAHAQDASALAKQLSNPIASPISVPCQLNYDEGFGPVGNGTRTTMNFQPVVPISLGEDWTLISLTIVIYDWNTDKNALPINFVAPKVTKLGPNLVNVGGGLRYWASSTTDGADDLASRLVLTILFPK